MRAVILTEFGGPEKLVIQEIENPNPGPDQVRVKINAFGLNRAEVAIRVGKYPINSELPVRLGFEGAGVVDSVGENVSRFKPGDRVSVIPRGDEFPLQGTYAEYCLVSENAVTHTPQNLNDEEAAALWLAYLTVWSAVVNLAEARGGEFLLYTAASSSLGAPAIQIARHEGLQTIACTRSANKIERIQAMRPDHIIDTSQEELVSRVKKITCGKGADIAFDCVAGPGINSIIKSLGFGARIVLYGALDSRPMEIKPMALMTKEMRLHAHMFFHAMADFGLRSEGVDYVTRGVIAGAFKPQIAKVFNFDDIAKAHEYMQSNEQVGKIVVRV